MKATKDYGDFLINAHNTLMDVQTSGTNSMKLVDCIRAIESVLNITEFIDEEPIVE